MVVVIVAVVVSTDVLLWVVDGIGVVVGALLVVCLLVVCLLVSSHLWGWTGRIRLRLIQAVFRTSQVLRYILPSEAQTCNHTQKVRVKWKTNIVVTTNCKAYLLRYFIFTWRTDTVWFFGQFPYFTCSIECTVEVFTCTWNHITKVQWKINSEWWLKLFYTELYQLT